MNALILFGMGVALMVLSILIQYLERQRMRQWFLSSRVREGTNIVIAYLDQKRQVLSKMGWNISRVQLVFSALATITAMGMLPFLFHEPWELAVIFAVIGVLAFDLGIRLYGLRFHVRFEKGLRESALPIGIETLTATGEAEKAVDDILHMSRDKVMLREFKAVKSVMESLRLPCEEAMLIRTEQLGIPAYGWLARYTLKMRQFGADTGEAWNDVLEELEDRDLLRTKVLSKTSSIRWGAYAFGAGLVVALLLFFHLIVPLMTGMMPFFFGVVMVSVSVGIYRLVRIGGVVQ